MAMPPARARLRRDVLGLGVHHDFFPLVICGLYAQALQPLHVDRSHVGGVCQTLPSSSIPPDFCRIRLPRATGLALGLCPARADRIHFHGHLHDLRRVVGPSEAPIFRMRLDHRLRSRREDVINAFSSCLPWGDPTCRTKARIVPLPLLRPPRRLILRPILQIRVFPHLIKSLPERAIPVLRVPRRWHAHPVHIAHEDDTPLLREVLHVCHDLL